MLNFAIYKVLLTPLVRRAPNRDALEVDSILATFGLLFVIQGSMLALFGGAYYSYSFLAFPVQFARRDRRGQPPRRARRHHRCSASRSIWR